MNTTHTQLNAGNQQDPSVIAMIGRPMRPAGNSSTVMGRAVPSTKVFICPNCGEPKATEKGTICETCIEN